MSNLVTEIKEQTAALHKMAEHSGFNELLFKGEVSRNLYGHFLLTKYHIYNALENGLKMNKNNEVIKHFYIPALHRKEAVRSDLHHFLNAWEEIPLTSAVSSYQYHLNKLSKKEPVLLIAHAYTLYLAELSGGQLVSDFLKKQYHDTDEELHTYYFNQISNIEKFKSHYHELLEQYIAQLPLKNEFVEEVKLSYIFSMTSLMELTFINNNLNEKFKVV